MPETTRRPLIEVARRYGTVACVSGRRASDARRIVVARLDRLPRQPRLGGPAPRRDRRPSSTASCRRGRGAIQGFMREAFGEELKRLRVRLEDKEAIAALHWRGVPDEEGAEDAIRAVAERAEAAGYKTHWGRKVLEIRPPVRIDKGAGIVALLRDRDLAAAIYVGDDLTDIDAFRGLGRARRHAAARARRCESACAPTRGRRSSSRRRTSMVDGTDGVRELLRSAAGLTARCGSSTSSRPRCCSARARRRCSPRSRSPARRGDPTTVADGDRASAGGSWPRWSARGSGAATRPRRRSRGCSPTRGCRCRCPSCGRG